MHREIPADFRLGSVLTCGFRPFFPNFEPIRSGISGISRFPGEKSMSDFLDFRPGLVFEPVFCIGLLE